MGVILCDSPTGPFAVVVIPKCGSTTVRRLLCPVAQTGQFDGPRCEKLPGWAVAGRYKGECHDRSWAVVRSPWKRILSRWHQKSARWDDPDYREPKRQMPPWPEYVRGICEAVRTNSTPTSATPQARILGKHPPRRIVDIDAIATWSIELAEVEDVELGPVTRSNSSGDYDWRAYYRAHPETRDMLREAYDCDWQLGIEWEDPCASA